MITLCALLAAAPPHDVVIDVKTSAATFSAQHDLLLFDGRIWWRRRGVDETFGLLPPEGLPSPRPSLRRIKELLPLPLTADGFDPPQELVAISADGDNLVAIDARRHVYYTKLSTLDWTDTWGPPGARGILVAPAGAQLAMSHRKQAYYDIDGNPHPVSAGVTTLYALSSDGTSLTYADPWLPPRFAHTICLPQRGQVVARAISASASTVMVMDAAGRVFTRLVDFDILGNNPALPYSYKREKRRGPHAVVRTLPAEDWREHARIDGRVTDRISIHVTGEGNDARELRVEGDGGYFMKKLDARRWHFVKTNRPAAGSFVDGTPESSPARGRTLGGARWRDMSVSLADFDPVCPPARLVLTRGQQRAEITLHFHETFDLFENARDYRGALVSSREQRLAKELMPRDGVLEVEMRITSERVSIDAPAAGVHLLFETIPE